MKSQDFSHVNYACDLKLQDVKKGMEIYMTKLFEGNRIYLRPVEVEDALNYYNSTLNIETRLLTGTQRVFTIDLIRNYISKKSEEADEILSLIVIKESNEIIGDIQLNDIDSTNRIANIRIAIDKVEHRGKGYGKEALLLILDYAFGTLNLNRIELDVYSFNHHAFKTYEAVGFKREGVKREVLFYNHRYHDSIIMSLLAAEYRDKYEIH